MRRLELAQLHMQRREIDTSISFAEKGVNTHPESLDARLTLVRSLTVRSEDYPRAEKEVKALLVPISGAGIGSHRVGQHLHSQPSASGSPKVLRARAPTRPRPCRRLERVDGARRGVAQPAAAGTPAGGTPGQFVEKDQSAPARREGRRRFEVTVARAEQSLKQAIQSDPSELESYGFLGQLYVAAGKLPEATQEFLTMAQLDPGSVGANTMLGLLYDCARERRGSASAWYQRAARKQPQRRRGRE